MNNRPIISPEESTQLDKQALAINAIPPLALMEEAADSLIIQLLKDFPYLEECGVIILAGSGNNGGDALAMARRLHLRGVPVSVYCFTSPEGSNLFHVQKTIIKTFAIPLYDMKDFDKKKVADSIILDGLFGIGYRYRNNPDLIKLFELINTSDAPIVSIDVPSGLTNGTARGVCADYTYSIGFLKDIFYEPSTRRDCGIIRDLAISFDLSNITPVLSAFLVDLPLIQRGYDNFSILQRFVHKYSRGAVISIGGTVGMQGAIGMSALAALRCGCGYSAIAVEDPGRFQSPAPELVISQPEKAAKRLKKYRAAVIGPGLSDLSMSHSDLIMHIAESDIKAVCDASFFSHYKPDILNNFKTAPLLTPHTAEFKHFFGISARQNDNTSLLALVRQIAIQYNCYILLKDSFVIAAGPDIPVMVVDHPIRIAAQAGSGDIISGILAGLIAQGLTVPEAMIAALDIFYQTADQYSNDGLISYPALDFINRIADVAQDVIKAVNSEKKRAD